MLKEKCTQDNCVEDAICYFEGAQKKLSEVADSAVLHCLAHAGEKTDSLQRRNNLLEKYQTVRDEVLKQKSDEIANALRQLKRLKNEY